MHTSHQGITRQIINAARSAERKGESESEWAIIEDLAAGHFRVRTLRGEREPVVTDTGMARFEVTLEVEFGAYASSKPETRPADCLDCANAICERCGPGRRDLAGKTLTVEGQVSHFRGRPSEFVAHAGDSAREPAHESARACEVLADALRQHRPRWLTADHLYPANPEAPSP